MSCSCGQMVPTAVSDRKQSLNSAVLAHFILKERLHILGVLGCVLCVVGSVAIVLHAPRERSISSVKEIWHLATEPGTYDLKSFDFIGFNCSEFHFRSHILFEENGRKLRVIFMNYCL